MTDRFLIGEAADEAATFHERANGAIVGFAPSAARFEQAEVPSAVSKFIKYSIPMKTRDGAEARKTCKGAGASKGARMQQFAS